MTAATPSAHAPRFHRSLSIGRMLAYSVSLLLAGYALLVVFPAPLFAYKLGYKDFRIYSHDPIDPNIRSLLDNVSRKLAHAGLESQPRTHRIFLCNSRSEFAFFVPQQRRALSINYQLGHNIFLAPTDIRSNHVGDPGSLGSTFTWIATHEIVHTLQQDTVGLRAFLALPFWKREGYAESIAEESRINLRDGALLLMREDSPSVRVSSTTAVPRQYFEARLLVQYYLWKRQASFQALAADPVDVESLRNEMFRWAAAEPERQGHP